MVQGVRLTLTSGLEHSGRAANTSSFVMGWLSPFIAPVKLWARHPHQVWIVCHRSEVRGAARSWKGSAKETSAVAAHWHQPVLCFIGIKWGDTWKDRALQRMSLPGSSNAGYRETQEVALQHLNYTKPAFHSLSGHSTEFIIVFDKTH